MTLRHSLREPDRSGSVSTLAECLHDYWVRTAKGGSIEETVNLASSAIERAASILKRAASPHPLAMADSDPEATSALIWLNALLFQELLASNLDTDTLRPRDRHKRIPRPDSTGGPSAVLKQWDLILEINWWPIFHIAREALRAAPPRLAKLALAGLVDSAAEIAERGTVRRHDVAGRIFHRLLATRKFLATNYTTVPAGPSCLPDWHLIASTTYLTAWTGRVQDTYKRLRVVDPACGSGTLLMAALQEILKMQRRFGDADSGHSAAIRSLLEDALHGYDVVPAAVHLTAATLSMAETSQLIANMPLFWMPHDVKDRNARMGSLDFLRRSPSKGAAQHLALFAERGRDAGRVTGTGEQIHDAYMPRNCDVMIANPPFTRAGGPGTPENTDWNPVFGAALSKTDQHVMTDALRRTLAGTPASLYAGLGSAFLLLARESVKVGGRLAFVLPATVLTGSAWARVREMLLEEFKVEWVVVSHDSRNRPKRGNLPGRRFVAFSESTRIAEALIVATKSKPRESSTGTLVRFVNLRRNPDEPIDAMAITRALLSRSAPAENFSQQEILIGGVSWGEVLFVEQARLNENPWFYSGFTQGRLVRIAREIVESGVWNVEGQISRVPTTKLSALCRLGPYHMQVKNPTQGLFDAVATNDPTRAGHPALWHHRSDSVKTLQIGANARLSERSGRDSGDQVAMLAKKARLHIASELGHAPQRVAAVLTDEPMIAFSSWITLSPCNPGEGKEEALCLWLNSTPGLLLRILHANRPYLGRSRLPHKVARNLPVLDVDALSNQQLADSKSLFASLKRQPLQGFAHLAEDPVRRELDRRFVGEVLRCGSSSSLDRLAHALNREPTLTARH